MNKFIKAFIFFGLIAVNTTLQAAGCQITSDGSMNFAYDVFDSSPTDSMSSLTVTCDSLSLPNVSIEVGISATSGSIMSREMQHLSLSDRMSYNLFIDPSKSSVWGDGAAGSVVTLSNINNNSPRQVMMYGSIPAGQNVSAGSYTDHVTVTVIP